MKIYQPDCGRKREIQLKLSETRDSTISVIAVNEDGEHVAILIQISGRGVEPMGHARNMLEEAGFETSCLAWDYYGAVMVVEP